MLWGMTVDRRTLLRAAAAGMFLGAPAAAPPRRTVYVVGDSTAAAYAVDEIPRAGWGQALPLFLDRRTVVLNEAVSASSSKSFADAGRLGLILGLIRPGDVLLISFGHGDESAHATRHTEPWTTYQRYLERYVSGARDAGAQPVLVTPVERRRFTADGRALPTHGEYPDAMRALALDGGTPLIDLSELSLALWEKLGPEATKDRFLWLAAGDAPKYPDGVADDTHFQARGAIEVARLVVEAAGPLLAGKPAVDPAPDAMVWYPTRPGPDPLFSHFNV
jgi:lysophospholipase L1-like esterase